MSLEIFKQNMLSYMQNQAGINSYGEFAKKLTLEYGLDYLKLDLPNCDCMIFASSSSSPSTKPPTAKLF